MLRILASLALLVSVQFAHADIDVSAVNDTEILGSWISHDPVFEQDGLTGYFAMTFNRTNMVASTICYFPDGTSLEPKVSVPVNVGNGIIQVVRGAKANLKSNGNSCDIQLQPGRVPYDIWSNTLNIYNPDRTQSMQFDRR